MSENLIEVEGLKNYFHPSWVHEDVNFNIQRGEISALIGHSGCGKTTVLRCLLMLLKPTGGSIKLFGRDITHLSEMEQNRIRQKMGMLFQKGALFSSLTVYENVRFPLEKHTNLPKAFIKELAFLKLLMVGIRAKDIHKYPSQISGGMQKRVAAARAIVLEPELLLLDEPVAGLDPQSAKAFDELLLFLRENLNLTIVMVSHDLDSLRRTTDNIIFLDNGRVIEQGHITKLSHSDNPIVSSFFAPMLEKA